NAAFGAQLKQGAEQAIADINEGGGILGKKLSASVGDDFSDLCRGESVANDFVAAGVKFVIGHFNSGITMATSEIYQANNILQITPASTDPLVTERNMWNIFRTCGRDDRQGLVAADYILSNFRSRFRSGKIGIVHDSTIYGQGLADVTRKALHENYFQEVFYLSVNVGDRDFNELVAKIRNADVELIYWGGLHTQAGLIVRRMHDLGIRTKLMGGDGLVSDEFVTSGGAGVVGTLMTYGPDPRTRPEGQAIVDKF